MAIVGYERVIYINDIKLSCVKSFDVNFEQPINEFRIKKRVNIEGIQRDQIDDQSVTINLNGLVLDDYENLDTLIDILQSKNTASIEVRYKDEIGAKNIKFQGFIESYNDTDDDLINYSCTITNDGEVIKGIVTDDPLFIFTTQKIGEINITTSGNNNFTDGNGNPLTMPFTRHEGDSNLILMYGDSLNTLTDITAINCQLIGDYDFTDFTALQNADFEGNAFDSALFTNVQFQNGTLSVLNSFVDGTKFTDFIIQFDADFTTNRAPSANLVIGSIDNPALLDPSDTTGTYLAIVSLQSKNWNVTVTANRLFTSTISGTKSITPSATFSGAGSVSYTLNSKVVSSISDVNNSPNTFQVNDGDVLACFFANSSNDTTGLIDIICNECSLLFIFFDQFFNESDKAIQLRSNNFNKQSITTIKNALDFNTSNGDAYTSALTVDINYFNVNEIYNTNEEYYNNVIDYENSNRLIAWKNRLQLLNDDYQLIIGTVVNAASGTIKGSAILVDFTDVRILNNPLVISVEAVHSDACVFFNIENTGTTSLDFVDVTFTETGNTRLRVNDCININSLSGIKGVLNYISISNTLLENLDLSNAVLNGLISFNDTLNLNNITFSSGILTDVLGSNSSLQVLNLQNCTLDNCQFNFFSNNNNINSLTNLNGTISTRFWLHNSKLTTVDFTNVTFINECLFQMQGSNLLQSLIDIKGSLRNFNVSNSQIINLSTNNADFKGNFSILSGYEVSLLDLSTCTFNLSRFTINNNPNLTDVNVLAAQIPNLGNIIKDTQTTINPV